MRISTILNSAHIRSGSKLGLFLSLALLLACILSPLCLAAKEEGPKPSALREIDPSALPSNWWSDLISKKSDLTSSIDQLLQKVDSYKETGSGPFKDKAKSLSAEIRQNIRAYLDISSQKMPEETPPPPYQSAYSIEKLIELNNQYVKEAIELEQRKDEQKNQQGEIVSLQKKLDQRQMEYEAAAERSEEKVLLGLQILSLTPSLEAAKAKLKLFEKSLAIKEHHLKYLKEEIKVAKERLGSNPQNQRQLARQLEASMQLWNAAKQDRQETSARLAGKYSNEQTETAKVLNQYLHEQDIESELKEIDAHNKFIKEEILYTLSELLISPNKIDADTVSLSLQDWTSELARLKNQLSEREKEVRIIVDRSAQLITLGEKEASGKSEGENLLKKNAALAQNNLFTIQGLAKEVEETNFVLSVLEDNFGNVQGQGEKWLRLAIHFIRGSASKFLEELNTTLFYIGSHPATLFTIIQFCLILIATWWIAKFVTATLNSFVTNRKGIRKAVVYRFNTLIRYFILLIGMLFALTTIGFDFSNLVLLASALGIGIGFGLQNLFNNFISGIIILFQSHLKVGDYVMLENGMAGEIREINVRSTVITTNDGIDVIVPNAEMISSKVANWTLRDPYRRIHIPFSVAYGTDLESLEKIVVEAAKTVPCTLSKIGIRDPQIWFKKFGDSALELELVVWVDDKWSRRENRARSMYLFALEKAFKKHGVEVPYPHLELFVKHPKEKE